MDAHNTNEEKARWELHKDAMCYLEQILEATPPQSSNCTAAYLPSQKPSK